jgi:hypothetical protein
MIFGFFPFLGVKKAEDAMHRNCLFGHISAQTTLQALLLRRSAAAKAGGQRKRLVFKVP